MTTDETENSSLHLTDDETFSGLFTNLLRDEQPTLFKSSVPISLSAAPKRAKFREEFDAKRIEIFRPKLLKSTYKAAPEDQKRQQESPKSRVKQISQNIILYLAQRAETLSPETLDRLAKSKVRMYTGHYLHQKPYETTELAAVCYYLADREYVDGVLAELMTHDPSRVVLTLIHMGAHKLSADRIGWFLRIMMLKIVGLEEESNIDEGIRQRAILSECGCQLIQAYLDVLMVQRHYLHEGAAETAQIIDDLSKLDISLAMDTYARNEISQTNEEVALKAPYSRADFLRMMQIVFEPFKLKSRADAYGWFIGILIEGCSQFMDYVKDKRDSKIETVATVLSVVFALAGLIPSAGPFMGIVGLGADKTLHHFYKSANFRELVVKVDGTILERVYWNLKAEVMRQNKNDCPHKTPTFECKRAGTVECNGRNDRWAAAAQKFDDMVSAKDRTQKLAQQAQVFLDLKNRIRAPPESRSRN